MLKKALSLMLAVVFIAAPLQPAAPVQAAPAEFFATPASVSPGAVVTFSGYGFTPDDIVELHLLTTPSQELGIISTDSLGNFAGTAVLPKVDPGDYLVMAAPQDVTTPITVLPAMSLELYTNSGPPGTIVHFVANNLQAGQLRLDYAGIPVFGPVPVDAGTFEGDFLVPGDRPDPLGTDAEVSAVNLLGAQVLGTAHTFFLSEPANPSPYTITNVVLPVAPVAPGYPFTVSGKIVPAPTGLAGSFSLKVLWKSASGQVAPITTGTPLILPDGSFTANANVPSLLAGDPLIPEDGGQVGVAFINNGNNGPVSLVKNSLWGLDPDFPVFRVRVVDPQNNPIPNALVDIRAFYSDFKKIEGETTGGEKLGSDLSSLQLQENQISTFLGFLGAGESDPFSCTKTNVYGRTDANGIFEVKFDPALIAAMGEKIFLGNLPKPTYMQTPMEITFPLYVNAMHVNPGFGPRKGNTQEGLAEPFTLKIRFSHYTNHFFNVATNTLLNTNPLVVTLYPLPDGTKNKIPIVPKITGLVPVIGGFPNYVGTGYPMTAFGNFYSFPLAQFPDAWFTNTSPTQLGIEFQHDVALFGELDETKLTFKLLPNGPTYPFINKGKKFVGQVDCDAVRYQAQIPNFHRFAAGNYTGLIEIQDTAANVTRHYIQLNFVPAPTWIQSDKYKVRKIGVGGNFVSLIASQYPVGGPSSSSDLDTNVPKVGFLQNRVSNQDEVRQYLYPDKMSGISFDGYFSSKVLNENADSKKTNGTVAGGQEIPIGPVTETVLNTGKMPLYRHVFGFPPVAGATLGADMWFDAKLTYDGLVKFLPGGGTSTTLTITPDATIGVDAFLDAELLFGLASAEAHAMPDIGLKMPTTFTDGSLTDTDKCFHYKLDISWEVSAGVWPFEWSEGDTENIFNDSNPKPCPSSSGAPPAAGILHAAPVTPSPPAASPAMAVDGFGHTLLLWVESGNIQSTLLSGGQKVADYPVSSSHAGSDPQVAFYAPNKAVAIWTESSLTSLQSQTATLSPRIDALHLRYALWNGSAWSVPASLTQPGDSGGEGKVALAGCMGGKASCPSGGAVTAVWVRNLEAGGSILTRQFRLFFSSFNGATWTSPGAVEPNSTSADTEPDVAYLSSGIPVAVWVRDADSSLSDSSNRRIAYRALVDGQPVVVDTSLPTGVVEPSLAINAQDELLLAFTVAMDPLALLGNQRQLHAARRTCPDTCIWASQALVDTNGRPVHAENPRLTLDASGKAQITYRALGFGSAGEGQPVAMKSDALGTILGTGEIAQAFVDFSSSVIVPSYLTNAGSTVWQVSAVFDPLVKQVLVAGSLGSSPVQFAAARQSLQEAGYLASANTASPLAFTSGPLVMAAVPAALDLAVSDVSLSTLYPVEGGELSATVSILNNGEASRTNAELKLTWDGPAGVGTPAGEASIPVSGVGSLTVIEFSTGAGSLVMPAFPHLPHTLYVQVNPSQAIPESDTSNNLIILNVGGLPPPEGLEGSARAGDSSVFLHWLPVDHPAVKGYRIYRSRDERVWEPVGSAFGTGFVDLSAVQGQTYWYAAVAYSEDGFESLFSNQVEAVVGIMTPVYLPLVIR